MKKKNLCNYSFSMTIICFQCFGIFLRFASATYIICLRCASSYCFCMIILRTKLSTPHWAFFRIFMTELTFLFLHWLKMVFVSYAPPPSRYAKFQSRKICDHADLTLIITLKKLTKSHGADSKDLDNVLGGNL